MEGIDREDTLKLYDKILTGTRIAVNSLECIARKSARLQLSGEIRRTIGKYEEIDRKAARAILTLGGKPQKNFQGNALKRLVDGFCQGVFQ